MFALLDGATALNLRHELADAEWTPIQPLLPPRWGSSWVDHRTVIVMSAVLYAAATSVPRRELHERFGPWQTV